MTGDVRLAAIEYMGVPGVTEECLKGLLGLLQQRVCVTNARILSSQNTHCLLLSVRVDDHVAIKSGFSSGYGGEGPNGLSVALSVLRALSVVMDEVDVEPKLIQRLDNSALTASDLDHVLGATPVRPTRWAEYIRDDHWHAVENPRIWGRFPDVIPFSIIDIRLIDLAISFWSSPDHNLLTGYRRLEDIVRKRTGLTTHGSRLFSDAFLSADPALSWKDSTTAEGKARANLFTAAYGAHRNRRAHREPEERNDSLLREFLLLNHLYHLEATAS